MVCDGKNVLFPYSRVSGSLILFLLTSLFFGVFGVACGGLGRLTVYSQIGMCLSATIGANFRSQWGHGTRVSLD